MLKPFAMHLTPAAALRFAGRERIAYGDVRDALQSDHDEALRLAESLCEADTSILRRELLRQLRHQVAIHIHAEEEVVYRAWLHADPAQGQPVDHHFVEHGHMEVLMAMLARCRRLRTRGWTAQAVKLRELLKRHFDDERAVMFAALGRDFSVSEREGLRIRYLRARARLASEEIEEAA